MLKRLFALVLVLVLIPVQSAYARTTAGNIFSMMQTGTTTIDQGGAIHSQTRSIYSMGGGMTSFQGKRVSLLAADPPTFSAGCSGISWHFGGFAFISADEIRQLVEGIAQASLGVVVDLAMQTLCPQCYAIMSKLRDISNMMRNAAADSCKVAKRLGAELFSAFGVNTDPSARQSVCGNQSTRTGEEGSDLASQIGNSVCSGLKKTEEYLGKAEQGFEDWLNKVPGKPTPTNEQKSLVGNSTYKALTALGYPDGFTKNVLMSIFGMEIYPVKGATDCKTTVFAKIKASDWPTAIPTGSTDPDAARKAVAGEDVSTEAPVAKKCVEGSDDKTCLAADAGDANNTHGTSGTSPTDAPTSRGTCYAPPLLTDLATVTKLMICGFNPEGDLAHFKTKFQLTMADNPMELMCGTAQAAGAAVRDYKLYICSSAGGPGADCLTPEIATLASELTDVHDLQRNVQSSEYSGLAFKIVDALFDGAASVKAGTPLKATTLAILNNSGYPLYRLLNMAAVYPGMAQDLLVGYSAVISIHYAYDSLSKLVAIAGNETRIGLAYTEVKPGAALKMRETIMLMIRTNGQVKNEILNRMAEKAVLVDAIVRVNKALQADVISQGLSGNAGLATTLKQQMMPKK